MLTPVSIGFRAVQSLLSAVALGLSVSLLKGQVYGSSPTTTRYSVFGGAFGLIVAVAGLASVWVTALPSVIPLALDAVAAALLLAAGIAWAIGLGGIHCDEDHADAMYGNGLLNEGCVQSDNNVPYCGVWTGHGNDVQAMFNVLNGRCKQAFADEVVMFILFAVCVVLAGLGWLIRRRGGARSTYV